MRREKSGKMADQAADAESRSKIIEKVRQARTQYNAALAEGTPRAEALAQFKESIGDSPAGDPANPCQMKCWNEYLECVELGAIDCEDILDACLGDCPTGGC